MTRRKCEVRLQVPDEGGICVSLYFASLCVDNGRLLPASGALRLDEFAADVTKDRRKTNRKSSCPRSVQERHARLYQSSSEFTVYWSYAANPIWHVQLRECVSPGDEVKTNIVYNHPKSGPQIKFEAEIASYEIFKCSLFRARNRTIAFHTMIFDPNADFHVVYRAAPKVEDYTLCARGGGHAETCKNGR